MDKLQRVMNAAARVISGTRRFDRGLTAHHVQAVSAGVQVFTRLCTTVSCRAMCTGRRHHGAPQSVRVLNFPRYNMTKLWPTSIFVRRPSYLELTARTSATNHFNRPFQALSKNVFIRADIALSTLETFLFNGLCKFTYLLTYLLL